LSTLNTATATSSGEIALFECLQFTVVMHSSYVQNQQTAVAWGQAVQTLQYTHLGLQQNVLLCLHCATAAAAGTAT
jgi:hypothetical protein